MRKANKTSNRLLTALVDISQAVHGRGIEPDLVYEAMRAAAEQRMVDEKAIREEIVSLKRRKDALEHLLTVFGENKFKASPAKARRTQAAKPKKRALMNARATAKSGDEKKSEAIIALARDALRTGGGAFSARDVLNLASERNAIPAKDRNIQRVAGALTVAARHGVFTKTGIGEYTSGKEMKET